MMICLDFTFNYYKRQSKGKSWKGGEMVSPDENIKLVKSLYESLSTRNMARLKEIVTEDVTWDVTEGFPFGGIYKGLNNVLHEFYGQIMPHLDKFGTEHERFIDCRDCVVALGYYLMTPKGSAEETRVRFAHIWGIRDGKITGVWQVADSAKVP